MKEIYVVYLSIILKSQQNKFMQQNVRINLKWKYIEQDNYLKKYIQSLILKSAVQK